MKIAPGNSPAEQVLVVVEGPAPCEIEGRVTGEDTHDGGRNEFDEGPLMPQFPYRQSVGCGAHEGTGHEEGHGRGEGDARHDHGDGQGQDAAGAEGAEKSQTGGDPYGPVTEPFQPGT